MRVLFVSAEVSPFAKVGGLADVAAALPRALHEHGVDVRVVMPKYRGVEEKTDLKEVTRFLVPVGKAEKECVLYEGSLPQSDVLVNFLGNDHYFDRAQIYGEKGGDYPDALERFVFLSRGALLVPEAMDWQPDIVHVNDWHTALVPAYLRAGCGPNEARSVLTIHNLAYQGEFPWDARATTGLEDEDLSAFKHAGKLNLLKGGINYADRLTTVSPSYAQEILQDGEGLEETLRARVDSLTGILNGIDDAVWNPEIDPHLWANYSAADPSGKEKDKEQLRAELGLGSEPHAPLVGMISRLAAQKGFDLVMAAFDRMMALGIQFVLLGTGAPEYEKFFQNAASRYPQRAAALITFSEEWAHRIEAAADIFLMPSRFEPCGLNQMYSLRYGTVPVVRATGGLKDTVRDYDADRTAGNGFTFTDYTPDAMLSALRRAVVLYRDDQTAWAALRTRGMEEDHSWSASARNYLDLYTDLVR